MQRRKFLTSSLTASALAATAPVGSLQGTPQAVSSDGKGREFYQLRCYHLSSGPQRKLCDDFFREASIVIEPATVNQAKIARDAYRDFGKGRHRAGLNFGDCFAYALAKEKGESLLFKGDDFYHTDVEPARHD